jgi:hypothetical protein
MSEARWPPVREFSFDGRPIAFEDGQSVAAALIQAGILSWRSTRRSGTPRGIFCGIGICYDCLIVLTGEPNHRACVLTAEPGMVITSQDGTGHRGID